VSEEHPLQYLFRPRSIAIPGASTEMGPGGQFVTSIKEMGFEGDLYPVNPKADEIAGLKCYPRLRDVPGDVDYVISCVPVSVVPEIIEDAAEKHVKAIHFFTAGFSETGDETRSGQEAQLLDRVKELGMRIIGPNCMGLYSPAAGLSMMGGLPTEPGNVGVVSQSGANAGDICRTGGLRGLRYSKVISYGNAADLDESDFLDLLAEDPETEIITGYIEGVKDGAKFMSALKKAAAAKPVIILKGGRTEAGGRATVSHTGSLAGQLAIFDAACRQAGAIRVESIEELNDCAVVFRYLGDISGPNMAIVGVGGGNSVIAADDVASAGLEVPHLPEATQAALGEFTPVAGTSVRNPVDTNVGFGPEGQRLMQETLRIIAEAPNIDAIILQAAIGWGPPRAGGAPDHAEHAREVAQSTAEAIGSFGKPIIMIVRPPLTTEDMEATVAFREEAAKLELATFSSVGAGASAIRRRLDWQAAREA